MHGFTNFQQSKALYERGYRHKNPTYSISEAGSRLRNQTFGILGIVLKYYPAFSLADIVTMQGERFYMPPQVSVAEVIEYNMKHLLANNDVQVQVCNQRLRRECE
jgi:hypothetical protein